jgi:hypothetical protein
VFSTSAGVYFATIEKTRGGRVGGFKIEVDYDVSFYEGRHIGCLAHAVTSTGPKLMVSINVDNPE